MSSDHLRSVDLAFLILQIAIPFTLLLVAFLAGRRGELRHEASLTARERLHAGFPCVTLESLPGDWSQPALVTGSVVISLDLFKRFLAQLRGLVGGEVRTYGALLDRARREALLRLKEQATAAGCDAVTNVRFETSRLASANYDGRGTAGVELLAFGTGLRRTPTPRDEP